MSDIARVVPVPGKGLVWIYPTDDPSVWFAESRSKKNTRYRIVGADGAAPACTCEARTEGCAHITAVLIAITETRTFLAASSPPATVEGEVTTTAVAVRPAMSGANVARQAGAQGAAIAAHMARGQLEGYREYLVLGQSLWESKVYPDSIKSPAQMAAVMLRASEIGVPAMAALEHMYIVGGKVAIMAQMTGALIERSGKGWVEVIESTDKVARVRGHREGRAPMVIEWTLADAQAAGSKPMGGWKDKLLWKAIARVGRRMFADVLGGMDVGDGEGLVIDYAVVPEHEQEQPRVTVESPETGTAAQSIAKGSIPPWLADLRRLRQESPLSLGDLYDYMDVPHTMPAAEFYGGCKGWLDMDPPTTPEGLIKSVADWIAADRPLDRPRAIIAPPPPPEAEKAAPAEPADIEEGEARELPSEPADIEDEPSGETTPGEMFPDLPAAPAAAAAPPAHG